MCCVGAKSLKQSLERTSKSPLLNNKEELKRGFFLGNPLMNFAHCTCVAARLLQHRPCRHCRSSSLYFLKIMTTESSLEQRSVLRSFFQSGLPQSFGSMSLSRARGGGDGAGGGTGTDDLVGAASSAIKRARPEKHESPPRYISESSPRIDTQSSDDHVKSAKTPRCFLPPRKATPKKLTHFHDDYELGEMLKEGAEGQAYICYKKQKFQGGVVHTFTEKKFVVKRMNLESLRRKGHFMTWEKLLQIKRGQSEIMMANVHQLIVKHLCSYEDEDAQEL